MCFCKAKPDGLSPPGFSHIHPAIPITRNAVTGKAIQPCFCLCLGFSQMTITRPLRLMILHFSQMGLTEGRTFMFVTSLFERPAAVLGMLPP